MNTYNSCSQREKVETEKKQCYYRRTGKIHDNTILQPRVLYYDIIRCTVVRHTKGPYGTQM